VTIVVEIAEAHDVASVPFHLLFDPTVLQWQGGREGAFLSSDGHETVLMIAPSRDGSRVVVGHSRLDRESGASGQGLLCTLEFMAVGPGDGGLAIDRGAVVASSGAELASDFEVASVTVY
jgi:hypothetical protein